MAQAKPLSGVDIQAPDGAVSGEAISHWTQDWWNAAVSGSLAGGGQLDTSPSGGQMFLVGGSFGGDVTGAFTVAAGTPLLVPVFNELMIGFTGTGPDPKNFATGTPAAASAFEALWRNNVTSLSLTVTDKSTGAVYTTNVWDDFAKTGWFTLNAGDLTIPKCQSVGYWAVVEGLKPGSYTLDFSGASKAFDFQGGTNAAFSVHVTDAVTVV